MQKVRVLDIQSRVPYPLHDGGALGMHIVTTMLAHHPSIEYGAVAMNTSRHWVKPDAIKHVYGSIPHWWARVDNRITLPGVTSNLVSGKPYHITRFFDRGFAQTLRTAIDAFEPHVILLEGLPLVQYAETIRSMCDAAIAYHAHNVEHCIWQRLVESESHILRRLYLAEQVRRLKSYELNVFRTSLLDAIITFTRTDAEHIRRFGFTGTLHVKPFAIDIEQYTPYYAPETVPTLFHIGSLQWQPNRDGIEWFVTDVMPRIREKFPSVEFHVAGSIPGGYTLSGGNTIVHGVVPDAQQFMQTHSILVVPLRAGSGVRVKIIEAMALGKAIVSTSIGAEGIECEPGKEILIADTAEDFARCVCQLLTHRDVVEMLGRNARRYAELHHDLRTVGGHLARFLTRIAHRQPLDTP
ncbi:MAG: glycosyltransferase family 4 protein [Chlorobi bacterium]|nr:glycosyltransferase family 4 protein [Chlorobiota bacterium]